MCGIVGIATSSARRLTLDDRALVRMRDRLEHRGPDDAELWRTHHIAFAHRRLAVLDPSPAGHQPMHSERTGSTLVYNGELYNDPALRRELAGDGTRFTTGCDTETLLAALDRWGDDAADRLRGMYAFAWHDAPNHQLLLARDAFGIKPLYLWRGSTPDGPTLVFASEPTAILAHPAVRAAPDYTALSAYLTTIRTTMGRRTLYEGIETLCPGEWVRFDLTRDDLPELQRKHTAAVSPASPGFRTADEARTAVREAMEDSVRAHLRSDVPVCTLLSGGLDSSIIARLASDAAPPIRTFASGAAPDPADRDAVEASDLTWAARVAGELESEHTTVPIDQSVFIEHWRSMVARLGVPLSTPNETAIFAVASELRAQGQVVALSGEGADELFAGYEGPLLAVLDHVRAGNADPGLFQLDSNAWIARAAKPAVLNPHALAAAGMDEPLVATWRSDFAQTAESLNEADPFRAHLAFQQRVNLAGLLQRLDTAMMLAGVEGRTPFADIAVARLARSLPIDQLINERTPVPASGGTTSSGTLSHPPEERRLETKIALREAFAHRLPRGVASRPKQSFPVPFQRWLGPVADSLDRSDFARHVFSPGAIALVRAQPTQHWHLAWPMFNIALWGEHVWG